jgi:hydroxymethylpyrimidine/phosphomethylpyrimidine kinase
VAVALTIAGSDPSGGAGIQADLKTFHQFGVYGEAVITLLTVQNTMRVRRVEVMPAALVQEQILAVIEDIPPLAAKTGALGSAAVVHAVADIASQFDFPLIVDPVMISKHGAPLMAEEGRSALIRRLMPLSYLITPNAPEAEAIAGVRIRTLEDLRAAAQRMRDLGARNVLIKGGHLAGPAIDLLLEGADFFEFPAERIATPHTHGTGCTFSAAITAELAKGRALPVAVDRAKTFITRAIRTSPGLGHGAGPVNHHAPAEQR